VHVDLQLSRRSWNFCDWLDEQEFAEVRKRALMPAESLSDLFET
jgi:hypothetical protein